MLKENVGATCALNVPSTVFVDAAGSSSAKQWRVSLRPRAPPSVTKRPKVFCSEYGDYATVHCKCLSSELMLTEQKHVYEFWGLICVIQLSHEIVWDLRFAG